MEMVQHKMPANKQGPQTVHPQPNQSNISLDGIGKLANTDRVILLDDLTCGEKMKRSCCPCVAPCCWPRRYKLTNVEKGYNAGEQKLYTIEETRCCCPNVWTLKDRKGDKVHAYTQTCCYFTAGRFCFGGPGFDVHDVLEYGEKGTHHGRARVPSCQCCNVGYDIRDANDQKKMFVGNLCNCCGKDLQFDPIWNDDGTEILKMNVHVRACPRRYCPLLFCLEDYWVVDFPTGTKGPERSELVAGTLMKEVL